MHHAAILVFVLCVGTTAQAQLSPHDPFPPGQWKIMAKGETGERQSLTIHDGREMKYINFDKVSVFPRLEVGREYRFPEVLKNPPPDPRPYIEKKLTALASQTPFRARVESKTITGTAVSLKLACPDGRGLHFRHTGSKGHEDAARLVAPLKKNETYEFPDIVLDRTVEPQKQPLAPAVAPSPDTLGPLRRYVGEWRGVLYTTDGTFITMVCTLRADGKGLWREIVFDDSSADPPMLDVAVLTHDPTTGLCLSTNPLDTSKPPVQTTWKEGALTFTTQLPSRDPGSGSSRTTTATFKGPDAIEWETAETDAQGKPLASVKGYYQRLIVLPEPAKVAFRPKVSIQSQSPRDVPPGFPGTPWKPGQAVGQDKVELLKLRKMPPFRAQIVRRLITEQEITVELDLDRIPPNASPPTIPFHARGSVPVLQERKNCTAAEWARARILAGRLEEGLIFDFPDVLTEGYLAGSRPQPTEAMKALEPFIGEWRHRFDNPEIAAEMGDIIVRYSWNSQGTGLWREVERNPPQPFRSSSNCLTTFDPALKRYVEAKAWSGYTTRLNIINDQKFVERGVSDPPDEHPPRGVWDVATQTYSWEIQWENGIVDTGSRRFVSPDLIEWKNRRLDKGVLVGAATSGFYERIKP